jgi:AraC-like DNA-binding protein
LAFSLQELLNQNRLIFLMSQDLASNCQWRESTATSVAVWLGMMMMPPHANRFTAAPHPNRAEPVEIWKARKFIHARSDEELSLTKVAKFVNISANHLSERFKEVTGMNFVNYIAQIRTEKACDLLQDRQRRISEIAFAVGFQSLSQFNRVFKKLSGKSPTEYRAAEARRSRRR